MAMAYEDINDILYRPNIIPGGGAEQDWGGSSPPKPPKNRHWYGAYFAWEALPIYFERKRETLTGKTKPQSLRQVVWRNSKQAQK